MKRILRPVLAFLAVFGLVSGLAEATPVVQLEDLCLTAECIHTASVVLNRMNDSANPCDDFYQFACGKYIDKTRIPEDKILVNTFSAVDDQLREYLKDIITKERPETDPRYLRLPNALYEACMNTSLIETLGAKYMRRIANRLGGWPVIVGNLTDSWTWQNTAMKSRRFGFSVEYLVDIFVYKNLGNNSESIIFLDQPSFGLQREYLIEGPNNTLVSAYYEYMVDVARYLGADNETARKELMESLIFEINLAKISWPDSLRDNTAALYNLLTIKQLQEYYPYVHWLDYINGTLPDDLSVGEDETINLTVPSFFRELGGLLNDTSNRVIANYIMWRIHNNAVDRLSEKFRKRKMQFTTLFTGKKERGARSKECLKIVTNRLSAAVGSEFVREYFKPESKDDALKMVTNIRKALRETLENAQWMDVATKTKAKEKLDLITAQIGYPDELLNDTILEEYYRTLSIDPSNYLKSYLRLNTFRMDNGFKKLRLPETTTDWTNFDSPFEVNAFYRRTENSIQFPAGILRDYFYHIDRPKYMNYGAMGSFIGHEITHAFDVRGSLYDGNGNLLNWWQNDTRNAYLERVKCIIEQYSNYTDKQTGLRLNGTNTQNENIADNGGIKQSYLAYTQWLAAQNKDEGRLPGLHNYTSRQMFWIATAQAECAKYRTSYLRSLIATGRYSPGEFRVLGSFSNRREFSSDFKCDNGTRMNPTKKCEVW